MQIEAKNIRRPTLFELFFDKLIIYSNEIIEYVKTSNSIKIKNKISIVDIVIRTAVKIKDYLYSLFNMRLFFK